MVVIDGTPMQQMINILVKVDLDLKDSKTCHNTRLTISNPKTLMGTTTHQEARDVVAPTWHDVDCEKLFFF
jgi:hypothetical protein